MLGVISASRRVAGLAASMVSISIVASVFAEAADFGVDLSETPSPFLVSSDLPLRASPLIEIGRGMNEVGTLSPGLEMPWGAVWQPALWIYGAQRTHVLLTDGDRRTRPGGDTGEVATRMDLFANLQLTGTERILAHIRPLDDRGDFTARRFSPSHADEGIEPHWDTRLESFFFEGDLAEILPLRDPLDREQGDWGFAFGKFPVEFQNGLLVRDEMTAVGLSKTNVQLEGSSGVRILGLWAFDEINEPNGASSSRHVELLGLFVEGDFPWGLLEVDVAATFSGQARGKQINAGLGWTGHFARNNYSTRLNVSNQFDNRVDYEEGLKAPSNVQAKDYDGALLTFGFSTELGLRRNIFYATGYWAEGDFGQLANNGSPPLGPIGLSFAAAGLGSYRPALWPRPLNSVGFAVGIQKFFDDQLSSLVVELAHREDLEVNDEYGETSGFALTARFQYKIAPRFMVQIDAYHAILRGDSLGFQDAESDNDTSAVRMELTFNF